MKRCFLILVLLIFLLSTSVIISEEIGTESYYQLAEDFINLLAQEDFTKVYEDLSLEMKNALTEPQLMGLWNQLISSLGDFQSASRKELTEKDGYQIVILTLEFEKAFMDARVVFNPQGEVAGFWQNSIVYKAEYKPPNYVNKEFFTEEEIQIGEKPWILPGTLSIPKNQKRSPGVVLVHGSGPNDRDETIGPNKVFRDIAWGLSSNGIAVLRYDKRTKVYPDKFDVDKLTVDDETIEDALKAIEFLRKDKRIDPERIYLLGHSLGGMLAPEIGVRAKKLAGIIIMAGNARPLEDLILEQYDYIFNLDGELDSTEKRELGDIKEKVEKLKDGTLGDDEPFLFVKGYYWKDLKARDQIGFARKLDCPILILQGARDYQVTTRDFEGWKEGLKDKKNVTFRLYPDLNHLLMIGEGMSTPSEYEKESHVDPKVIEHLISWIMHE